MEISKDTVGNKPSRVPALMQFILQRETICRKKNKIDPGSLQVVESAEKEVNMEMRVTDGEAGAIVSDAGRVQRPQPVTGVQKEHHRQNRGKGSETGKGSAL